ncbi:MAG: hypothetical protein QM640_07450 [Niabella sp.]
MKFKQVLIMAMTMVTLKINERSKVGKSFMAFIEAFSEKEKEIEIVPAKSLYNPEFVAKIRCAEKQKSIKVNPDDIWESLGLQKTLLR